MIKDRLDDIKARVRASAKSVGRTPDEIRLIAVSKRQPFERLEEAYRLGLRDFGENTAQGLAQRVRDCDAAGLRGIRWHFVGQLQSNKVRLVAPNSYLIHSLDRLSLAEALSRRSEEHPTNVLLQINIGKEAQKGGVPIDQIFDLAQQIRKLPGIRVRGLMGMPPFGVDSAPYYRRLGTLFGQLSQEMQPEVFTELSMGMSGDFETAIRYGATHVRVGTAIFGERPARSEQ
ncbi:MAG: YggS family pyridoxal phosphate-dependent enzyme [Deltaproteobacteria bacterium]|jgi:PLP dependent protein|nr:YggS family pyridoxal phosphate-dependent enzyme [Deltaproteobacteria bacterium]MBT6434571.1 YggS family pyridoxal phosphate-dependent enzyme [Deltaproteobacteria bacterium]